MKTKKHYKKAGKAYVKKRAGRFKGKSTVAKIPKTLTQGLFPDIYRTVARTIIYEDFGTGTAYSASTPLAKYIELKGNGFFTSASTYFQGGIGPKFNSSGVFANAFPSGLGYLLGLYDNSGGGHIGGNSPYYKYRINKSTIRLDIAGIPNSVNGNFQVAILPSDTPALSLSAMTSVQFAEQPFCKTKMFSAYDLMGKAIKMSHTMSTLKVIGDKYKSSMETGQFDGAASSDPAQIWTWIIRWDNLLPNAIAYAVTGNMKITIDHHVEFFDRNPFTSYGPNDA